MPREMQIHVSEDGKPISYQKLLEEFTANNPEQFYADFEIEFIGDSLISRNTTSFITGTRRRMKKIIFSTWFPKNAIDPKEEINCIINWQNNNKDVQSIFQLYLGSTDDKTRKKKYGKNILQFFDISRLFNGQPIKKIKPILVLDPNLEIESMKLWNYFPPEKFLYVFEEELKDKKKEKELHKELKSKGYLQPGEN